MKQKTEQEMDRYNHVQLTFDEGDRTIPCRKDKPNDVGTNEPPLAKQKNKQKNPLNLSVSSCTKN